MQQGGHLFTSALHHFTGAGTFRVDAFAAAVEWNHRTCVGPATFMGEAAVEVVTNAQLVGFDLFAAEEEEEQTS